MRSTDVPQGGDGLDIVTESLQELCRMLDGDARRRELQEKGPSDRIERRHCPITANKFAAGEGGRSVKDCDC